MCAHARGPVIDRPDLQVDRLDAAERRARPGPGFCSRARCRIVERLGGQAGADDIDPVEPRLVGDLGGPAREGEARRRVIVSAKCLAILYVFSTAPTASAISAGRAAARACAERPCMAASSVRWPSRSSRLRRALGGEIGIAAHDQPLAGKVGRRDRWPGRAGRTARAATRRRRASALIAGARNAVIQSSPAGLRSSAMRAWVIMPRSPTSTTWVRPKRCLSLSICAPASSDRRCCRRTPRWPPGSRRARKAGRRRSAACRCLPSRL